MEEAIIAENDEYFIKMFENPKLDSFSDIWKKLQFGHTLYMTFEAVSSYVKNIGNIGDIVLFILERKDNKTVESILPLKSKNYHIYKKFMFLFPKAGSNYELLGTKNRFFIEEVFHRILSERSIVVLQLINPSFLENLVKFDIKEFQESEHFYVLTLPKTWQELLNTFDRKFRKNLNYYQRKITKDFSVSFENIKNLKENKEHYESFVNLHKSLIKDKHQSSPFEYKPFVNYIFDLISGFENNGGIFSIKLNGNTVCILLYVDWNNTRYFLNIGSLPDYKNYSVSRILIAYAIQDAINKGMKYFNFGQGDEPYKEDWGCKKFDNKSIKISSNWYVNSIDSLITNIYNLIKYFMRTSLLQFPKKIWMNIFLRKGD